MQNVKDVDSKMLKRKNAKIMLSSKCAVCSSEKIKIYKRTRSNRIIKQIRSPGTIE